MEYSIIFEEGENSYGAYVPDLPGCIAVGDTIAEVRKLIVEAIALHIESLQEDGEAVPHPSSNSHVHDEPGVSGVEPFSFPVFRPFLTATATQGPTEQEQ